MIIFLKVLLFVYIIPMIIGLIGAYREFKGGTVSEFCKTFEATISFIPVINIVAMVALLYDWTLLELFKKISKLKIK